MAGPEFVIAPRGSNFSVQLDGVEAPATTFDAGNMLSWQGDPAADGKWIDGWSGGQRFSAACDLLSSALTVGQHCCCVLPLGALFRQVYACMWPVSVFCMRPIAHVPASQQAGALLKVSSSSLLSAGWLSFVVLSGSQAPVFMGNVFKANEGNGRVPKGFNFYGQSLSSD